MIRALYGSSLNLTPRRQEKTASRQRVAHLSIKIIDTGEGRASASLMHNQEHYQRDSRHQCACSLSGPIRQNEERG